MCCLFQHPFFGAIDRIRRDLTKLLKCDFFLIGIASAKSGLHAVTVKSPTDHDKSVTFYNLADNSLPGGNDRKFLCGNPQVFSPVAGEDNAVRVDQERGFLF